MRATSLPMTARDPLSGFSCRDVLVLIDGSSRSRAAIEEGILLAEKYNARLTILSVKSRALRWLSLFSAAPPHCLPRPSARELEDESHQLFKGAIRQVPAGIPVTTIRSDKSRRAALREALGKGDYGAVVDCITAKRYWYSTNPYNKSNSDGEQITALNREPSLEGSGL